jgi:trypsin
LSDTFEIFEEFLTLDQIIHPKYSNETDQFDVMLVKLNGTSLVDTVRINDNPDEPRDDSRLTVVGWGITEEDNASSHPNIFQEVDLVHLNNDECKVVKNEYGQYYDYWITDDMLCAMAMARNRDSCFGDSGSPLIQQGDTPEEDIQVGIVSWGVGCDGSMPGVHSRLSSFSDWIREMTCFFSEAPSKHTGCMPTTPTLPPTFSLFTAPQLSSTSPLSTVRNETEDYSIPNSVIEIDDLKENVSRDYEDGEIETESSDTSNSNASNLVPSIFVVLCTLYQINVISRF